MLGEGVAERGKGVGPRRVWEGGWGKGGGEGGGEGGWGEALIEVLNKTGIVTLILVIGMHITRRNRPKSRKNVIISPEKVRKRDVREISPNYLCKKEPPSWKNEKNASLRNFKLKY